MAFCKISNDLQFNNTTDVENIFILEFLPYLSDKAVKVYLYGLYLCYSNEDNSIENFAKTLSMPEFEVENAFKELEAIGAVNIINKEHFEIQYIMLRHSQGASKKYKPEKYADFNQSIQKLFPEKMITLNEYNEYYHVIESLHIEPSALLMIAQYCIKIKGGNVGFRYIISVARNWAELGITTIADVEEKLMNLELTNSELKAVLKALSIRREPTVEDRNFYQIWTQEMGYKMDVVIAVAKKLKSKGNFEKLDTALKNYRALNLFTLEEIENYNENRDRLYNFAREINTTLGIYYQSLDAVVENYIVKWTAKGFGEEGLLQIADLCFKRSVRTLEGMEQIVNKLFKSGVISDESVQKYIQALQNDDEQIRKIFEAAGIDKVITSWDRDIYRTWTYSWLMPMDAILYAASLSAGKTQQMTYMNRILSEWNGNNLKTLDKIKKAEAKNSSGKSDNKFIEGVMTRQQADADSSFEYNVFDSINDTDI